MTLDQNPSEFEMDPRRLVSRDRLDIAVKYLYLSAIDSAIEQKVYQDLYLKHIFFRTGGVEPTSPWSNQATKRTLEHYVEACEALLGSIDNGFDSRFPIPIGDQSRLLNGAHRISAALLRNIPVQCVRAQGDGPSWGFDWFESRPFTLEEKQRILLGYTKITPNEFALLVFWGPVSSFWTEMLALVEKELAVVGFVDIDLAFHPNALHELVMDVYQSRAHRFSADDILRKAALLEESERVVRAIVVEAKAPAVELFPVVLKIKQQIRQVLDFGVPKEAYVTMHSSADPIEANYLAGVLLSPNNLRHLFWRSKPPTGRYLDWLKEFEVTLSDHGIPKQDVCIVGSSPLEVVGIRASTDIDFIAGQDVRAKYGQSCAAFTENVDLVNAGYHWSAGGWGYRDEDIIRSEDLHFTFRGYKHCNLDIVRDRKLVDTREKDRRDSELISRFFDNLRARTQNRQFPSVVSYELAYREIQRQIETLSARFETTNQMVVVRVAQSVERALKFVWRGGVGFYRKGRRQFIRWYAG